VGDTHTVKIEGKGKGGDGIARVQGFVIFVPGVNVGDEVKVRITAVRRRFAIAEVVTE
jgi:predicted RNA-binding protein with TRAM domain